MYQLNYCLQALTYSKLPVLFLSVALLLCVSCSDTEPDPSNELIDRLGGYNAKTIKHDGVERSYQIYLPSNFDKTNSTPLVFALHGGGGTATRFENDVSGGSITDAAEERGVIVVMPDGIDKRWNDGRAIIFGDDMMFDDVGFISTIIDNMIQEYGVDPDRVYSTGISNGGLMSVRLAMDLSNKIAAIAPVTAQISKAMELEVPEFPISVMIVNGEEDPLVPFDGGCIDVPLTGGCRGDVLSTQESIEKFRNYNQCTSPAEEEPIINNLPFDRTSVEITRYKGCRDDTEVVLVKVIGGGHTWPGGVQYLGPNLVGVVSREVNASELIFDFFLSHSRK